MRRLLDINTWIALSLDTHPQHRPARLWYEQTSLQPGDLVFCRQTELGFLRLITQAAVMARCRVEPLSNTEAIEFLGIPIPRSITTWCYSRRPASLSAANVT
jgi:predicted nucleic acid-binding protein